MLDAALSDQATDPPARALIAGRPALSTHAMDGPLLDGVPLAGIAAAMGTPCWVYGADSMRARFRLLRDAMPGVAIHYAVKAQDHLAVLGLFAREGAGADVVSGGELLRALAAGIAPEKIVFSGVGKTRAELALAVRHGIAQVNLESAEELHALSAVANGVGATARVALRVNPDVDAGTHDKIATGRAGDKFGIPHDTVAALYARAAGLPGIEPVGLAVHIGSQLHDMRPFRAAYKRVASLVREIRAAGLAVSTVDCGGGLGVGYRGEAEALPEAWAGTIAHAFGALELRLAIEPGRWLVAGSGVLLASVVRTRREGMARPIVVLDAAMNDLARPALYDAWHGIVPVLAADLAAQAEVCDVVGPVCESGDVFGRGRLLDALPDGAPVAILDAGAYGSVMSSPYNARPRAAQVLVDGGRAHTILARRALETLWEDEIVPGRERR